MLVENLANFGVLADTVEVRVSTLVTDPWQFRT